MMWNREVEVIIRQRHGIFGYIIECKQTIRYNSTFTAQDDLLNFIREIGL